MNYVIIKKWERKASEDMFNQKLLLVHNCTVFVAMLKLKIGVFNEL